MYFGGEYSITPTPPLSFSTWLLVQEEFLGKLSQWLPSRIASCAQALAAATLAAAAAILTSVELLITILKVIA